MICSSSIERMKIVHGNQFVMEIKKKFEDIRKQYNLKKVELQIINYLFNCEDNANTAKDITIMLHMNKAMVSKNLDALSKRNLVFAKPDEKDRRFIHYFVTEEAKPIIEGIQDTWVYMEKNLFVGVTEEERDQFYRICKILHSNLIHMQDKPNE